MRRYVYKIISTQTTKIYIGSTNNKKRYQEHTSRYTRGLCSENSSILFDLGLEYCSFHILEEFECDTYDEQLEREQFYMDMYAGILVNKQRAKKHKNWRKLEYERNKEQKKQYQLNNRERISKMETERQKIYIHCNVCDKDVKKRNLARHNKQPTHLSNLISLHTLPAESQQSALVL
jgi:hypothetical protein